MGDGPLLKECKEERYRASGPGGQRRNKVETSIRLRHQPSGVVVQGEDSRSLAENRKRAMRRLRERIATSVRQRFDLENPSIPPEFARHVSKDGRLTVNNRNRDYALVVATVVDAVTAAHGVYAVAATSLGLTTSQLRKFLEADREVWRAITK
jgi:hypothetical protein